MSTNHSNCNKCEPKPCKKVKVCTPIDLQGLGLLSNKLDKEIVDRKACCEEIDERVVVLEGIDFPNPAEMSRFHKNYDNLLSTFSQVAAPDGSTIQYPKKLNVGDTLVVNGCAYENIKADNQTRPETNESSGWNKLCPTVIDGSGTINTSAATFLVFSSCDNLTAYAGTLESPLLDGLQAIVQNDEGCYEIYVGKWFTDLAGTDNDNDSCSTNLTYHPNDSIKEFRWRAYSDCHKDVYADGLVFQPDGTILLSNSDGTTITSNTPIGNIHDYFANGATLDVANNKIVLSVSDGSTVDLPLPVGGDANTIITSFTYSGDKLAILMSDGTTHNVDLNTWVSWTRNPDNSITVHNTDGTNIIVPKAGLPTSMATVNRAIYNSPTVDTYAIVPLKPIGSGTLTIPACTFEANGTMQVINNGIYSISLSLTHQDTSLSTCRVSMNVLDGNGANMSSFLVKNTYDPAFLQAKLSWSGYLHAGHQIQLLIDNGTIHTWDDPAYSNLSIIKVH